MIDRTPISNGWYGHQGPSKNIYSFNFFQIQFASKNVLTSLFINHLFFLLKFESFAIVCGWSRNHANVMWFAGAQPPVWWIFPRQFLLIRNNHSTKVCFGRMKFDGVYSYTYARAHTVMGWCLRSGYIRTYHYCGEYRLLLFSFNFNLESLYGLYW